MKRGKLFTFSRFCAQFKIEHWDVVGSPPEGHTVFVCHHWNMAGPVLTLYHLPFSVRPWVLHVFTDKVSCKNHYRDYTFSQRFGLPKFLAAFLAWCISGYVSALMASMGAIPVYRGSFRMKTTFRESIAALKEGDSLLIFPDVDYSNPNAKVGEIYDGFLHLDRFWHKVSDAPLNFVPLRLDPTVHRITIGPAFCFCPEADPKTELIRIRESLRAFMNEGIPSS